MERLVGMDPHQTNLQDAHSIKAADLQGNNISKQKGS